MPYGRCIALVTAAAALACGCMPTETKPKVEAERIVVPPHVSGTVAEHAFLFGGGAMDVQGYGIVIGLGQNGSAEIPPRLRTHFRDYLRKQNFGSYRHNMQDVTPERLLNDKDTAVVLVGGSVPPGAPEGSRFDVYISALPNTQTRSLDGGVLMPLDLSMAIGGMAVVSGSTEWAEAAGPVFVNPFLDPTEPGASAKLRAGRVLNGGRVTRARPVRLVLRRPDYALANLIQRRINERFPDVVEGIGPGRSNVANARDSQTIEIAIPRPWRRDYHHFLRLILHLVLKAEHGEVERKAREVAEAIRQPGANYDELAMVWEAMGRQIVPLLQPLYADKNPAVAFHAARTGMRLEDTTLAAPVVLRFAQTADSPYQTAAIRELGAYPRLYQATAILRRLLEDENERVVVAAYEALRERGDVSTVQRLEVGGMFDLDLVRSERSYVIYATQSGRPRIVLFGQGMAVRRNVFYNSPDDLVTINAHTNDKRLTVFRKIPRTGGYSESFEMDFFVRTLITKLGEVSEMDDDGDIRGLGLTYGQIVGVLQGMCKQGDIPAKFVLQPPPSLQRIYTDASTTGRPD